MRIFAARDGERVTGRAELPYEMYGRTAVPIDYRSHRPPDSPSLKPRASSLKPQASSPKPQASSLSSLRRLAAVERWRQLCRDDPATSRTGLARQVAAELGVSVRSIQLWARRLDTEGPEALEDHYVPALKRVPTLGTDQARQAVLICAWWAFRIGNVETIDAKAMQTAGAIMAGGYKLADVLATIDYYYAYRCDRAVYPFKRFDRWAKYDLDRWLIRAATDADYARAVAASKAQRPLLQPPSASLKPQASSLKPDEVPDSGTRARDTRNRRTRRDLRNLSGIDPHSPIGTPQASSLKPQASSLTPQHKARVLAAFGQREAARREIAKGAPGVPPLADCEPQTMAEALAKMDDRWRAMLLRAGGRNTDPATRQARAEAITTLPLWWPMMPWRIRCSIDVRLDCWGTEHGLAGDHPGLRHRKFLMLLPYLRPKRSGAQRIGVALRLPCVAFALALFAIGGCQTPAGSQSPVVDCQSPIVNLQSPVAWPTVARCINGPAYGYCEWLLISSGPGSGHWILGQSGENWSLESWRFNGLNAGPWRLRMPPRCLAFDGDGDGDVDLRDISHFLPTYKPAIAPDPMDLET